MPPPYPQVRRVLAQLIVPCSCMRTSIKVSNLVKCVGRTITWVVGIIVDWSEDSHSSVVDSGVPPCINLVFGY